MADISQELDNFKNAKYGKDVRGSMVSLAEKLNKESSDTVKTVSEYGDAEASREQAEQDRQNAENARQQDFETMQSDSQAATTAANEAAKRAEQAATGDMSLKTVTFEVAAARAGIVSGDTLGVAFGKLAKYCTDLEDHAFNALVNNGLANIAGVSALDAVQANPDVADTLAYKIAQNLAAITSLNSNTSFEFTASNEVSIINNKSVKVGRVVYVAVKIKIESKLTTDSILNFADIAKNQSTTFLIGKGSEWNIDSVVYGYISGNSILINNSQETISVGDFLHINTVLIL